MNTTTKTRGGSRPGSGRKKKNAEAHYKHLSFTADKLKELTDSPYVNYVSNKTVSYTKAFKNSFWLRYCDGIDPLVIFSDAGFNIQTLGKSRILSFLNNLEKLKQEVHLLQKTTNHIHKILQSNFHFLLLLEELTKAILKF